MKTHVFLITAKTNLHVGNESGGEFSIIDKAIQRDPLTGLPCINSSSLKGAIKEYCVHVAQLPNVKDIFGSDVDKDGKVKPDTQKGSAIFFDAKLLYLPQQDDKKLFHYVTTEEIVSMMNSRVNLFAEGFNYSVPPSIADRTVERLGEDDMVSRCHDDNLPIIARNVLENGESKNLWYEQVLPAETVLYTIIREEFIRENGEIKKDDETLMKALDGKIVQIGAGATTGYGYCKFECIYSKED